jgi:hypothetical protein
MSLYRFGFRDCLSSANGTEIGVSGKLGSALSTMGRFLSPDFADLHTSYLNRCTAYNMRIYCFFRQTSQNMCLKGISIWFFLFSRTVKQAKYSFTQNY